MGSGFGSSLGTSQIFGGEFFGEILDGLREPTLGGEILDGEPFGGETFGGEPLGGDTLFGETLGGEFC